MKKRIGLFFSMLIMAVLPGRMMAQTDSCVITSVPVSWDFESANNHPLPFVSCWQRAYTQLIHDVNHTCYLGPHSGSDFLLMSTEFGNYPHSHQPMVVLPAVDTNIAIQNLQLSMYLCSAVLPVNMNCIQIGVMTDPTDTSTLTVLYTLNDIPNYWHYYEVPLSSYTSTGRYVAVRFLACDISYGSLQMDDVTLDLLSACSLPLGLEAANVMSHSVQLSWFPYNSAQPSYVIHYRPENSYVWMSDTVTVGSAAYTVTGLSPMTTYQLFITPMCDASKMSDTVTFTTTCALLDTLPQVWDFETDHILTNTYYPFIGCWQRSSTDFPRIVTNASYALSGSSSLSFAYNNTSLAILPQIDTNMLDIRDLQLTFNAKIVKGNPYLDSAPASLTIGVMTDPEDPTSFEPVDVTTTIGTTYETFSIPLYAYNGSGSYIAIRNNITPELPYYNSYVTYLDDLILDMVIPCAKPLALEMTNVTDSSALLIWQHNDNTTPYLVCYKQVDETVWTLDTANAQANHQHLITGLLPNRTYEAFVIPFCDDSAISKTISWTTDCYQIKTVPSMWNFESDNVTGASGFLMPRCWGKIQGQEVAYCSPHVSNDSYMNHSGIRSMRIDDCGERWLLVLPELDTAHLHLSELMLSMWTLGHLEQHWLEVGVLTDPTDASTFYPIGVVDVSYSYQQQDVVFASYPLQGTYIALRTDTVSGGGTIYVDDLMLLMAPTCNPPENLQVDTVTATEAKLTWNCNTDFGQYVVIYKELSDSQWTSDTIADIGSTVHWLTNLTPATAYEAKVMETCIPDSFSNTVVFNTLASNPSVPDRIAFHVFFFPNPALEYVDMRVDGDVNMAAMEVYDVYGKAVRTVVETCHGASLQTRINVSNLSAGIYFVRVTTDQGSVTKRFVKQ